MQRINILGINYDNVNMYESLEKCNMFMLSNKFNTIATPNPEIIMQARKDLNYRELINDFDLVIADGIGVIIASKILKKPLKERVAGFDLINNMFLDKNHIKKVYLLGAKPGVAEIAKEKIEKKYGIEIVGLHHGYYKKEEEKSILEDINHSGANILLVGMGMKKQELFIQKHKPNMDNVRIAIGCGGSIDVFAGTVKRAPKFFQKHGLEWFYRLIKQPNRIFRMMILPKFLILTIFSRKEPKK